MLRLLLLCIPAMLFAQPPANYPNLYYAFFTRGAQNAAAAAVNGADAARLNVVAAAVTKQLADLDRDLQAYQAGAKRKGQPPKATTLQAFDGARALLSLGGARKLRENLTPQGWREFETWINGPFRASLGGK
jgi:hypothetical protein